MVKNWFKKAESLIALDIGSSAVRLLELDVSVDPPVLKMLGAAPLGGDVYSNNTISKSEKVADQITSLLESNAVGDKRVVTAVPGPAVFTKRIKIPRLEAKEIQGHVFYEASNFIPHNIEAVKLDYHILGDGGKGQLDVLVVAVKNEIIDGLVETVGRAGLATAIVDVDYFALQNMFEFAYPELASKTVVLVNIGARYSGVNICRNGESLFVGDVMVGGRQFTDAIAEAAGITQEEAEKAKRKPDPHAPYAAQLLEALNKRVESAASEFNRQLSFFWNATGADDGIDCIMLTGGGALTHNLAEAIAEKTGIEVQKMDVFRGVKIGPEVDAALVSELAPTMAVGVGLALRQPGDKVTV